MVFWQAPTDPARRTMIGEITRRMLNEFPTKVGTRPRRSRGRTSTASP